MSSQLAFPSSITTTRHVSSKKQIQNTSSPHSRRSPMLSAGINKSNKLTKVLPMISARLAKGVPPNSYPVIKEAIATIFNRRKV